MAEHHVGEADQHAAVADAAGVRVPFEHTKGADKAVLRQLLLIFLVMTLTKRLKRFKVGLQ